MKLSPQKTIIVEALRSMEWVCGRTWLNQIKDDRKRIQELREGYMREKGYDIISEPCKGSACGKRDCPLYKRKAVKITPDTHNKALLEWFDNYPEKEHGRTV